MSVIQATIPVLYRSVDMDGVILDCNQPYADRLGYSMEEVVGTSLFDHSTEETRGDLRASFAEWKASQKTNAAVRLKLKAKDGEVIDAVMTYKNRYEGGNLVGRDASIMEASAIREMQNLYNVGARSDYEDPEVIRRSVDYMGTIVDCSQSYLDRMGYAKDEVVGISLYEHTAPRSKGNLEANMNNWRIGHHSAAKIWMMKKDGREFPALLTSADETNKGGIVVGRTVSLKVLNR